MHPPDPDPLQALAAEARACRVCSDSLPCGPRPVFQVSRSARLLIVGQAPGRRVHETGIPWNDPSGDRLRRWMGIGRDLFYDPSRVAILPAGLCYPGSGPRGDAPPRPECAPLWHPRFRPLLDRVELTLLIGRYAQAIYLRDTRGETLSDTIRRFEAHLPRFFPLPHPSPRNQRWFKERPWLETDVIPALQIQVKQLLG